MKKMVYAFRFLTTLPIRWKENENLEDVAKSVSYFPFVGLFIGILNAIIFKFLIQVISAEFASLITIIWWIIITGGLHLDGIADSADGLFGGRTPQKRLDIMKDSRIGTYGVLAVTITLLLKIFLIRELNLINTSQCYNLLIISPVIGRWNSVFLIFTFKTARKDGLGNFFKQNITIKNLIFALLFTTITVYLFFGIPGLATLYIVTIISSFISLFVLNKIGGLTGDIYGSLCEMAEIFALITGLIWLSLH